MLKRVKLLVMFKKKCYIKIKQHNQPGQFTCFYIFENYCSTGIPVLGERLFTPCYHFQMFKRSSDSYSTLNTKGVQTWSDKGHSPAVTFASTWNPGLLLSTWKDTNPAGLRRLEDSFGNLCSRLFIHKNGLN